MLIDLYGKLGLEARHAIFAALNDSLAAGDLELGSGSLAANLVRTPSILAFLESEHLSGDRLFTVLQPAPIRESSYDRLKKLIAIDEAGTTEMEIVQSVVDEFHAGRGFKGLQLATSAITAWRQLSSEVSAAPPDSVSSKALLVALLKHDSVLRAVCEDNGLHVGSLENSG
jgi:hypothetical protein